MGGWGGEPTCPSGYWRKQLDHVCAHLRSFAHNDAPFRTLLGEPRLGRVRPADGPRRAPSLPVSSFLPSDDFGRASGKRPRGHSDPRLRGGGGGRGRPAQSRRESEGAASSVDRHARRWTFLSFCLAGCRRSRARDGGRAKDAPRPVTPFSDLMLAWSKCSDFVFSHGRKWKQSKRR